MERINNDNINGPIFLSGFTTEDELRKNPKLQKVAL